MTPNQLPPLPRPKFTETIRGVPCLTVTEHEHMMHAYALAAIAQQAQMAEQCGIAGMLKTTCPYCEQGFAFDCPTCSGHGLIGGHMPDGSGHGEPCPACNAPQVPAPVDELEVWLPIESAPKDGTRLILWWGGKPVFAGWLDNSQCKHPWAGWQTPSLTPRPQGEPTHYMLLPSAPQTKDQP